MRTAPMSEIRQRLKSALLRARTAQVARSRKQGQAARFRDSEQVRLLGQLMVGASGRGGPLVYDDVAGYGSELMIEDVETGESFQHRLMTAEAMDLEAGHITLDSPLGDALLRRQAGDVVEVETPSGVRRVCVVQLETLPAFLDRLNGEAWRRRRPNEAAYDGAVRLRSGTDG